MKLNHLNLCVHNLPEAVAFFQNVFGFQLVDQKGDIIAALLDDNGFSLVLGSLRSGDHAAAPYPKDFHLGFYVDTTAEVDQFYNKLVLSGISPEHGPRKIRSGYSLYFTALDGILFEVTCYNG